VKGPINRQSFTPPKAQPDGTENLGRGGLPETMHHDDVHLLVTIYQRYESAIALRLFRTLHELERLQRMRQGEQLPAPTAVDVTVGVDRGEGEQRSTKKDVIEAFSSQPGKREEVDSGTSSEKRDDEVGGRKDN
jgi:hypothetical protein